MYWLLLSSLVKALWYAHADLKEDKEVVLAAVKENVDALRYAHADFMLAAVRQHGWALRFASEALKNDREVVLAAVRAEWMGITICQC